MKRLFALLTGLTALVLFSGCSNKSPAAPASSAPTYTYPFLFTIGTAGSGNGQFNGTAGIAVYQTTLFVADWNNSRIEKFDLSGNYLGQWSGGLNGPNGVAVDKNGVVYVADTGNNQIQKYDVNGNSLGTIGSYGTSNGQLSAPAGVAVDSSLNVYVTENGNDRVQKFDSTGAYVSILGGLSSGTGNGQFDAPYGVAVDSSGNVYVADTNNNRVQVLNSSLVYQSQWGAYGTTNGTLDAPTGIAADPDGNLIITNDGASATEPAVQKFSAGGTLMKVIAVEGPSTGQIKGDAFYIAVDSNKNVYVADYGGARVDKFAPY